MLTFISSDVKLDRPHDYPPSRLGRRRSVDRGPDLVRVMKIAIQCAYLVLMLFAVGGGIYVIFGGLSDYGNRYPLPLLIAAMIAGTVAQLILKLM